MLCAEGFVFFPSCFLIVALHWGEQPRRTCWREFGVGGGLMGPRARVIGPVGFTSSQCRRSRILWEDSAGTVSGTLCKVTRPPGPGRKAGAPQALLPPGSGNVTVFNGVPYPAVPRPSGAVDDVVPVGVVGWAAPVEGDVGWEFDLLTEDGGLTFPGVVGVLSEDDAAEVGEADAERAIFLTGLSPRASRL